VIVTLVKITIGLFIFSGVVYLVDKYNQYKYKKTIEKEMKETQSRNNKRTR
jgi:hypothetical protein